MCVKKCETHNALQFPVFFIFVRICKAVFLNLKMCQYRGLRRWVQPFPRNSCKNWCKNWYTPRSRESLKHISYIRVPLTTQLGRMITYLNGLLCIKSNDALITWYFEIKRHTKTILSPLSQCFRPPNLAGWWQTKIIISSLLRYLSLPNSSVVWLTMRRYHSWSPRTIYSCGYRILHGKLGTWYLH